MAYGLKYYCYINDHLGNDYTVSLLKDGYVDDLVHIRYYPESPLILNYRGSREDENETIFGSDVTFNFWVDLDYSGTTGYDYYKDLIESNYRDWKIVIRRNSGTIIVWQGWLKPENTTLKFVKEGSYVMSLFFNCGLADLKDNDFPVENASGHTSVLSTVKTCLTTTDHELDIAAQLNIHEVHLTSADNAMKNIYINTLKYKQNIAGEIKTVTNYNALRYALNFYGARLCQQENTWHIAQNNETYSTVWNFDWDNLATSTYTINRVTNIDSKQYYWESDEISKIAPLKTVEYKRVEQADTDNFLNATMWNNSDFDTVSPNYGSGVIFMSDSDPTAIHYIKTDDFTIPTSSNDKDYLDFTLDIYCSVSVDDPNQFVLMPLVQLQIQKPDETYYSDYAQLLQAGWNSYTFVLPKEQFKIAQSGTDYAVRIWFLPQDSVYTSAGYAIKNYRLVPVYDVVPDLSKLYKSTVTTQKSPAKYETDIMFADRVHYGYDGILPALGDIKYKTEAGALSATTAWYQLSEKPYFENATFDAASLSPWATTGTSWTYGSGKVRGTGSNATGYFWQGPYGPGAYKIRLHVRNDNGVLSSIYNNGFIRIHQKSGSNYYMLAESDLIQSGTEKYLEFDINLNPGGPYQIAFSAHRAGPGTAVDMTFFDIQMMYPTQGINIITLLGYNQLRLSSSFKNYVRITIRADYRIKFNDLIQVKGKTYKIVGYSLNFRNNILELDLVELTQDYLYPSDVTNSITTLKK